MKRKAGDDADADDSMRLLTMTDDLGDSEDTLSVGDHCYVAESRHRTSCVKIMKLR